MKTQWMLDTHGDPLGTLKQFLRTVWQGADLEGMLVPLNGSPSVVAEARLIKDFVQIDNVNPFKPLINKPESSTTIFLLSLFASLFAASFAISSEELLRNSLYSNSMWFTLISGKKYFFSSFNLPLFEVIRFICIERRSLGDYIKLM